MKFNLAFILIAICCNCFAQGQQFQNNNWYFGNGATMSFPNNGAPILGSPTSLLFTDEGSSSISDINGNLLFYTNGGTVWDANDAVMPNGTDIQGYPYQGSSTQSCIILKQPVTGLYYIFTVAECGVVPHNFSYTIVDMTLNLGLGDVVVASKNVFISDSTTEKIAATYVCANPDRLWVLTHEFGSNKFVARALTAAGLGPLVTTSIGPVINNNALGPADTDQGQGSMKFSHDGLKIAICNPRNPASLDLYDFDKATGLVSNRLDLYDIVAADEFYGLEFSPNNQYLYVTNGDDVSQYDISSGVAATIKSSRVAIGTPVSGGAAVRQVQLAPDGKIYCAQTKTSTFLGIINNPNVAGAGCNWDLTGFDVDPGGNGFKPRFGLPSQLIVIPTKFNYQNTPDEITLCKTGTETPNFYSPYPVNNGVFSCPSAGLVFNTTTGVVNAAASTIGTYTLTFTAPLTGCVSPFFSTYKISIITCTVLPIELTEFNGISQDDHSKLYWTTATEINNDYFILEKSDDGITWRDIARIDGAGNSTQINNYSFNDYELLPVIMYYRLKQVDFDGKKTYSQIVTLHYTNNNGGFAIFPNPSKGIYTIKTNATILSYDITDNLGQLVHTGTSSLFDISMLADGVYFIKIKLNNEIVIKKIIKNQ